MRRESRSDHARQGQRLLIGPWAHGVPRFPDGDWVFGDVSFGTAAKISLDSIRLRWFDHYLKGVNNGVDREAPVHLFVMGANVWRDEQEWPLARAVPTPYYLHGSGFANTRFGNGTLRTTPPDSEPPDRFRYDPRSPVPTHGGHGCCDYAFSSIGPFDQRVTEQRPDVLVYTSAPLEDDVEVTGFAEAHLVFSTDVVDTDFFVTLSDVDPDGRSIVITDGQTRARFRRSTDRPVLVVPNRVDSLTVHLWGTSNLFKRGHQIRVRITSSNFPRFARNLNSGKPAAWEADRDIRVATQTVFHSKTRASRIVLPIVPRRP
jgi:putative CocE/NonD family hydrolase